MKMDYNADGDVSSVWGTVGANNRLYAYGFSYNSSGAMERMRLGNGKWETAKYNERLQITEIGLGNSATDKSLLKLEYGYGNPTENNGNLRTQKISFNGLSQPFEQTYTYDSLNRLQDAKEMVGTTQTWKQTFQYDRFGNRRFDAANTTTLGSCSQAVCNPLINTSDNRFSSGQNYAYDANGNLTGDTTGKQFLYDAENHQKEVKDSANVTIGLYVYDGEGKRIKKTSSTETVIFVYDGGGQLVAEYSTALAQTPQVSYLTADHLGSPRVITDQNGKVTTRKDYMAFGDEASSAQRTSGISYDSSETRKGYTGYEKDSESGLEFAQARYYNATHGRFTSVDPLTASASIKNPQTFNRYSYVLNSPYKFTDPLGLLSVTTSACGQWCSNSYQGEGRYVGSNGNFPTEQHAEGPALPPPAQQQNVDRAGDYSIEISQNTATQSERETDDKLSQVLTDGKGFVRADSSLRNEGGGGDTHYRLQDGTLHTLHIYGSLDGNSRTGIYIPKRFNSIKYIRGEQNSVLAIDTKTGEVLRISHINLYSNKELKANIKLNKTNEAGSIYIGDTGGKGGNGSGNIHSHISYFKSFRAMNNALESKYGRGGEGDYSTADKKFLNNLRNLIK